MTKVPTPLNDDQTLYGMEIVISDDLCRGRPRMECSPRFCELQSPELVAETNAWMLEFFGKEADKIYIIEAHFNNGRRKIVTTNAEWAKIRKAFEK